MIDGEAVDDSDRDSGRSSLLGLHKAVCGEHDKLVMLSEMSCIVCQPSTSRETNICYAFSWILDFVTSRSCSPSTPISADELWHGMKPQK